MKPDKLKLAYKLTFCYLLYHILLVTAILFFVDRGIVLLENRFEEKYRENAVVSMDALNQRILQLKDTLTLAMYGENVQVLRGRKGSLTTYEEVNLKLKVKSELSVLANQYGYIKDLGIYIPEYETWIDVGTWFENQSIPGRKLFGDVLEVRSGEICLRLGMQNEKKYMEGYACLNSSELQKLLDQKIADNMRMQVTIDGQELSELGNAQDYYPITVRSELYPIEVTYYIPPEIMSLRKYLYVLGGISILFLAITAPQAGDTVEVPRLILQPIVENAYKYVFEHVEKEGKLIICAEENDTTVTITIEDSGYQMGEDVLCRIQDALKKEDVHITGLGNLEKRLQFVDPENKIHAGRSSLGGVKMVLTVRKSGREKGHA